MSLRLSFACLVVVAACGVPSATELPLDAPLATDDGGGDAAPTSAHLLLLQPSTDFGDVVVGATSVTDSFTVRNDGDDPAGAITLTVADPGLGFVLGDDTCTTQPLLGHHDCTFDVAFQPTAAGAVTTTVAVAAEPGGAVSAQVGGTGLVRGALDVTADQHDFGPLGVDDPPITFGFEVTNPGQTMTGAPAAQINGDTAAFAIDSTTCTAGLAPHTSCTITVRFDPPAVGHTVASLRVADSSGSDTVGLEGTGTARVVVDATGTGAGLISSTPDGIDCGTDCAFDFDTTPVSLTAAPAIGSTFVGWSGDCTLAGSCSVVLSGRRSVHAQFRRITPTLTTVAVGSGRVTSLPTGIDCGALCQTTFDYGTPVALTATPSVGSTFTGWSGDCSGAGACMPTMTADHGVTATFAPITPRLTVTLAGDGRVTADVGGISCGSDCFEDYHYDTPVTLTAVATDGNRFVGWTGACTGAGTCSLRMDAPHDVTATFAAITPVLTVTTSGAGHGTVTTHPDDVACAASCTRTYPYATPLTATAAADPGSVFAGWSSACTGEPCALTMTADRTLDARFDVFRPLLRVTRGGTGAGTVTGGGLTCGAVCNANQTYNAAVLLTAAPTTGSLWSGWSGPGAGTCGASLQCLVTMDQARDLVATFDLLTPALTVTVDGTGAGTVSDGAFIDCGAQCSHAYPFNTPVTLHATAATGSTFVGWSGACATTAADCVVTIDRARQVTATFDAIRPTLTLDRGGTGGGTLTATAPPAAPITCGATCSGNYAYGAAVVITATAASGDLFTAWTGDCAGVSGTTCTLTLTANRHAGATFTAGPRRLTVTRSGAGTGTVRSADALIDCGATCSHDYAITDTVVLTAAAATGASFLGWSGDCASAGTSASCTVAMDAVRAVTATFGPPVTITIDLAGTGTGTVTIGGGTTCTADCTTTVPYGTSAVLFASATNGGTFTGWSGAPGCTTSATCTITPTAAMTVVATFAAGPQVLRVTTDGGDGLGVVRTSGGEIDCGTTCSRSFAYNTPVTLTATASSGHVFDGWSGDCAGVGTCTVTMSQARNVTARFMAPRNLGVTIAGTGTGGVTSSPVGLACTSGTCSTPFPYHATVAVTATATGGSTFRGWSGASAGQCASTTAATCTVSLDAAVTLIASFDAGSQPLTVTRAGTGTGTVAAPGLACAGATCTGSYAYGTSVTVTATADAGSTFVGWSGLSSTACTDLSAPTCTVQLTAARTLIASFRANPQQLTVTIAGTGTGTVASDVAGIACPGSCAALFDYGTPVTVTATATGGSAFGGWSGPSAGACSTAASCTVTMSQARSLTASFTAGAQVLTLTMIGSGTVTAPAPNAVNCTASCTPSFPFGTSLALTATPAAGWTFTGWEGLCLGTGSCSVTLDQARAVTARFAPTLTVSRDTIGFGAGAGTVTSNVGGISCGATCTASYPLGSSVVLTAAPAAGSTFVRWSGACASATGASCTLTMDQVRTTTATFAAAQPLAITTASSPAGYNLGSVSCNGTTCAASYAYGQTVTLTANPGAVATFGAWTGAPGCTTATSCAVVMDQSRSVTATFNGSSQTVTITKVGTGTVTGGGLSCGATCTGSFTFASSVVLAAAAPTGWTFTSWTGCDSTAGTQCTLTMTGARSPTATFTINRYGLTVTNTGEGTAGTGTVTGGGINCGATCSGTYDHGTVVMLTATASATAEFNGWSGACAGAVGATCAVTMDQARTVGASFVRHTYTLTTDHPFGTLTSSPAGINCTSTATTDCSEVYVRNTPVTLSLSPRPPHCPIGTFAEPTGVTWTGCVPDPNTDIPFDCTIVVTADLNVSAVASYQCVDPGA